MNLNFLSTASNSGKFLAKLLSERKGRGESFGTSKRTSRLADGDRVVDENVASSFQSSDNLWLSAF
jgi:hypothetical protein